MQQIGFVGLGHMGYPMVINLLKAGFQVKVYDLNSSIVEQAVEEGAKEAKNFEEVACGSDCVFTMLQTAEQVRVCVLGDSGIFSTLSQNALFIDSSSIDVKESKELHAIAKEKGIAMLDAPVSGGVAAASAGSLTFMVGGCEKAFKRAESILKAMGKNIIHAGEAGSGEAAKICNNMILGISMLAVSEAFQLADQLGLKPEKLFEICNKASGQCWSLTNYCPWPEILPNAPSSRRYEPGFTANMMLKDLNLSQTAATSVNLETKLGSLATNMYQTFVEQGGAEIDFSGILLREYMEKHKK